MTTENQRRWKDVVDVSAAISALPAVQRAIAERRPLVLTCPLGHDLVTVELRTRGHRPWLHLRVLAERGSRTVAVAEPDGGFGDDGLVCADDACNRTVERYGWCAEHGGNHFVWIDDTASTRFTCARRHRDERGRRVTWSDRLTAAHLLRLAAIAFTEGADRVSVTRRVS